MTSGSFNSNNVESPKKGPSKTIKTVVGVVLIAVIAAIAGSGGSSIVSSSHSVEYEITGSASVVSVTYTNADGGTSQLDSVTFPWALTMTAKSGDIPNILAQKQGDSGSVTVTIYNDGNVFKKSTNSGAYVIATAAVMLT
jgi:hypothetical protein